MAELAPVPEPAPSDDDTHEVEQAVTSRYGWNRPDHPLFLEPTQLTAIDDVELMRQFEEANGWWEYLDWEVELLTIDARRAAKKAERTLARITLDLVDGGTVKSRAEGERRALLHDAVVAAEDRAAAIDERARLTRRALVACERRTEKLSREITRRTKRDPVERRAARWTA